MSTRATDPVSQALLAWMQQNGGRLRALLDEEAGGAADTSPMSDAAIRGHLRFVAEAIAAHAAPGTRESLSAFAAELGARADASAEWLADALAQQREAMAMELDLQFGDEAADDPTVRKVGERRMRLTAWHRLFLHLLDEALGTGDATTTGTWMADHQARLGDLIFATDRSAKQAVIEREGDIGLDDPERVNLIGQAATLQAHTRFLVEAIGATRT